MIKEKNKKQNIQLRNSKRENERVLKGDVMVYQSYNESYTIHFF